MISQNYPLWVAWVVDGSELASKEDAVTKDAASILWHTFSGRVIGWWTVPGDSTTELIPVVAGPGYGRAFPVSDDDVRFFYGDSQNEAVSGAMDYQLRDTMSVWLRTDG